MRYIWLLKMTDEGDRITPGWEINTAIVVVAVTPREARLAASLAAIDEGSGIWLTPKFSSCSKVGVVTSSRVANGVLVASDTAS